MTITQRTVGNWHADREAANSRLALRLSLVLLLSLCALAWFAVIVLFRSPGHPVAVIVLASTLLLPIGLLVWANAASGKRWALLSIVFAVAFVSDASVRSRPAGDTGLDTQSLVKVAIWLGALALLPWFIRIAKESLRSPTSAMLFAFGLWATITTAYSVTPAYTFAAGMSFLGIWTIAVIAAHRFSIQEGLTILMAALLVAMGFSLLLYGLIPDQVMTPMENGRVLRLSGIFGSPNNLGRAAALALLLIAVFWGYGSQRGRWWFAALLLPTAVACLYLSGSRASLGGLIVGLLVVVAHRSRPLFFTGIALTTLGGLVALFFPIGFDDLVQLISRTGKASEITTFTGRTEIWAWVMTAIEKEPWLGYGFATSRILIPEGYYGPYGWTTTSAHNMWLQIWLTTGGIGLAILALAQLSMIRDAFLDRELARDAVVAFVFVIGLMEAGPVGPSVNLLTFVWIWAAVSRAESRPIGNR